MQFPAGTEHIKEKNHISKCWVKCVPAFVANKSKHVTSSFKIDCMPCWAVYMVVYYSKNCISPLGNARLQRSQLCAFLHEQAASCWKADFETEYWILHRHKYN